MPETGQRLRDFEKSLCAIAAVAGRPIPYCVQWVRQACETSGASRDEALSGEAEKIALSCLAAQGLHSSLYGDARVCQRLSGGICQPRESTLQHEALVHAVRPKPAMPAATVRA